MGKYVVVLVTVPSEDVGADVARTLLERELAACVNVVPSVDSFYTWEGELCRDAEVLLVIKTLSTIFDDLASAVQEVHPYDVPEIIALPIVAGSRNYLDWIDQVVADVKRP